MIKIASDVSGIVFGTYERMLKSRRVNPLEKEYGTQNNLPNWHPVIDHRFTNDGHCHRQFTFWHRSTMGPEKDHL